MRWRRAAFAVSAAGVLATVLLLAISGLNLGLDFTGGILIEARAKQPIELASLRQRLDTLALGDIGLQTYGRPTDVLVRVQDASNAPAVQERIIAAVASVLPAGSEIRRTEVIGPQVSAELLRNGIVGASLAVLLIGVYVWFRFEWQFGLCAVITTFHDVLATVGLFALLRLEFNLPLVAALLTIAGYSINDTVVIFDRIRENLRRYKTMPFDQLIDLSINQTLSRTVLTSATTLIAVLSLLLFGGPVLRGFALALTWGIVVGTVSTIFVAAPLVLYLKPSDAWRQSLGEASDAEPTDPTTPHPETGALPRP